jgi:hypothetical protein
LEYLLKNQNITELIRIACIICKKIKLGDNDLIVEKNTIHNGEYLAPRKKSAFNFEIVGKLSKSRI